MNKIKIYINELNSHLFISLKQEDEKRIINDNFMYNVFKAILFALIVSCFQAGILLFYVFRYFFMDISTSSTYILVTFAEIFFLIGFAIITMNLYIKDKLPLPKQKMIVYLFLIVYLIFQIYFVSIDYIKNGTLVGLYFDLIIIGGVPLFPRKVTYSFLAGYTIVLVGIITYQNGFIFILNNITASELTSFASLLGFYIIAKYNHNIYLKILYLQSESEKIALLRDSDNKKLFALNKKLQSLTTTDDLTNIPNRRAFDNFIDKIWFRCFREKKLVTVFMIDIDDFKLYNDNFGHQNGDKVLYSVAQTMSSAIKRKNDLLARYGGEEFIAILPYTREDNIVEFANNIINNVNDLKIKTPPLCKNEYISVSVGIATCVPSAEMDYSDLIKQADKALYVAKNRGKNCYVIYNEVKNLIK